MSIADSLGALGLSNADKMMGVVTTCILIMVRLKHGLMCVSRTFKHGLSAFHSSFLFHPFPLARILIWRTAQQHRHMLHAFNVLIKLIIN